MEPFQASRAACAVLLASAAALASPGAHAGDFDLQDPPQAAPPPASPVVVQHPYTLAECLALTDRNHPNLWAARARLSYVHAQLDEAKWIPFWQYSAQAGLAVAPRLEGTPTYTQAPLTLRNLTFSESLFPAFQFGLTGVLPLYTFGKISAGRDAAEAQVKVSEWDLEKNRQQVRMDVRRAYFGLMLARDAKYIVTEVLSRLDRAIAGSADKADKGEKGFDEIDTLRLEVYRDEIRARSGEAAKGEQFAIAALRFMTGVQSHFDIVDRPLHPPDRPLAPIVSYLTAARLFRPEINMARAGVVARQALVNLARAKLFPDVGIALGAGYSTAPSAVMQNNIWTGDGFNYFYAGAALGVRWSLDIFPGIARVGQAEAQLEETRALERLALGGLAVEVEQYYGAAAEARLREESWAHAEKRSKHWISLIQDQIDLGTKDERALMEPLRAYINARVNHSYALMDYNLALSDLARVTGWDAAAPQDT